MIGTCFGDGYKMIINADIVVADQGAQLGVARCED